MTLATLSILKKWPVLQSKKYYCLMIGCLMSMSLMAQDTLPRFTLKTSISSLINPLKQSAQLGSDIRLSKMLVAELGAGYYFGSSNSAKYEGESYNGLHTLGSLKLVPKGADGLFSIGIEYQYNRMNNLTYRRLLRQGAQYIESKLVKRNVQNQVVALSLGGRLYLDKKDHIFLDFGFGFGLSFFDVNLELPPESSIFRVRSSVISTDDNFGLPTFFFRLKAGYAFW